MSNEQLAISNDPQTRQMKDSGVECIGEIPESWEIRRNKELFYEVNDRCSADTELPLLSVSEYHGVTPKVENSGILTRAESLEGYKICKENDIVMNIMLAWKRAQAVSKYQGIVSPAYCVYRNKSNGLMNMDYVHYLIRSDLYIGIFKMYSTGIIDSRLRLYPDKFLSLYSHVPPADVQQTIAAYLDRKCTQIDTLIANQQQQIEKLKAYKQSVITETVTKGLDPDVAMKDSGVEWIDCIPETWKMVRGKGVFNETDSRSTDGNEELLTVSQYTGITPRSEKNVNMFEAKTLEGYKICETGDIAANTMWMWAGAIGVSNYSGVISPSYNVYLAYDKQLCLRTCTVL